MKGILYRYRGVGIGVAAFLLFAVVVGIAGAQPGPQNNAQRGAQGDGQRSALREQFLNTLATNLGLPVDRVRAALEQTREQMRPQVQDAMRQHHERMHERMGERFGQGPGMGMGMPPMMGGAFAGGVVADVLGMDRQTLMQELQSGKTLAQIGQEHGMTPDQLTDQIVQRITQMQQQAQQNMRQHIRESLDQTWPPAGGQDGPGRRGPASFGPRGQF
jgi:hypothetical protein